MPLSCAVLVLLMLTVLPNVIESKSAGQNGSDGPCEENWDENGSHCYYWSTQKMNWTSAESFCQNKSGHLASVTSRNISDYVTKEWDRRKKGVWIGGAGQEKDGTWRWTDSSPWNFSNWWQEDEKETMDGEHNCLAATFMGRWANANCKISALFLCSKQK